MPTTGDKEATRARGNKSTGLGAHCTLLTYCGALLQAPPGELRRSVTPL